MTMVSPYRGDYVSQEHEDGGGYAGHAGIDLAGPVGRPVYAPYDGVIEKAAWGAVPGRSGYGKVLRNYDGEAQYFGHLRDLSGPGVGAKVKAGDVIGYSGNTGNSSGPHLHFEMWHAGANGEAGGDFNPRLRFNAEGVVVNSATGQRGGASGTSPYYTRAIDGDVSGIYTGLAFQRFLADGGYYTLQIDGHWGKETNKAAQRWLSAAGQYTRAIDGDWGPETVKALQRVLAARGLYDREVDGDFGPYTKKGLQRLLAK